MPTTPILLSALVGRSVHPPPAPPLPCAVSVDLACGEPKQDLEWGEENKGGVSISLTPADWVEGRMGTSGWLDPGEWFNSTVPSLE